MTKDAGESAKPRLRAAEEVCVNHAYHPPSCPQPNCSRQSQEQANCTPLRVRECSATSPPIELPETLRRMDSPDASWRIRNCSWRVPPRQYSTDCVVKQERRGAALRR